MNGHHDISLSLRLALTFMTSTQQQIRQDLGVLLQQHTKFTMAHDHTGLHLRYELNNGSTCKQSTGLDAAASNKLNGLQLQHATNLTDSTQVCTGHRLRMHSVSRLVKNIIKST